MTDELMRRECKPLSHPEERWRHLASDQEKHVV